MAVTPNPAHDESPTKLLRVTPGQRAWESLGALPFKDAPQAPFVAAGTVWLLNDALTMIYTATYP